MSCQKPARPAPDIRLMPADPEQFGRHGLRGEGSRGRLAEASRQLRDLAASPCVNAIEDGRPDRPAIAVHNEQAGAQASNADAFDLVGNGRQFAGNSSHIGPPDGLGVLLRPARLGIGDVVVTNGNRDNASVTPDEYALGSGASDIDPEEH